MGIATLIKAIDFAARKHREQRRKGAAGSPYINPPIAVANILVEIGEVHDTTVLTAAILHDTIEDTETTAAELSHHFGEAVSVLVQEVTDDKSLPKARCKELQIQHAPGSRQRRHSSNSATKSTTLAKSPTIRHRTGHWNVGWSIWRGRIR